MKKALLFLILLIIPITTLLAYENAYFSIYIPSDYQEKEVQEDSYLWTKDNNYIMINVERNKESLNIKNIYDEDLNKQKEYIEQKYKEQVNSEISVTNIKKYKGKRTYYIEYDIQIHSKDEIGYDIYQKQRLYMTDNLIYIITFSSDNTINNQIYTNLVNSFIIKDSYLRNLRIKPYFILLLTSIVFLLLIYSLINIKKH